jgi:hypothetical protein
MEQSSALSNVPALSLIGSKYKENPTDYPISVVLQESEL